MKRKVNSIGSVIPATTAVIAAGITKANTFFCFPAWLFYKMQRQFREERIFLHIHIGKNRRQGTTLLMILLTGQIQKDDLTN